MRITFDGLEHDPREVWQVPEIRVFMKKLVTEVPGLAFFLSFDPDSGMVHVLYLSLADPSAQVGNGINLDNPSFIGAVVSSLTDMRALCDEAGVDWLVRCKAVLRGFPEHYQESYLRVLKKFSNA